MNANVEKTDDKIIIKMTLKDYGSVKENLLDMIIEISPEGIEIRPANEEDRYDGDGVFHREVWTEFYGSQLQTMVWDGTQEDPVRQHVLLEKGP